jgi:hypothetical protein
LPRLSCGELKRLPRFSRCAVAPWREEKKQYCHAKLAKPRRKTGWPSPLSRFHRPSSCTGVRAILPEKNGVDADWLPAAKRLQDLDVPDLSSGKSRKLPLLFALRRCAVA